MPMKKTLLFAAVLCGMTSFATTEVKATFASLENGAKSGDYTVATRTSGFCITGPGESVSTGMTAIIKYSNLGTSDCYIAAFDRPGSGNDRFGIGVKDQKFNGVYAGSLWTNANQTKTDVQSEGVVVVSYSSAVGVVAYDGTGAKIYEGGGLKESATYNTGTHINFGSKEDNSLGSGMTISSVQLLSGTVTTDTVAAIVAAFEEAIKSAAPAVEPIALFNFGYTKEEDGWYNYHQDGGNNIGPITTNNVSFTATKSIGNFFYTTNDDFGEVDTDFEGNGTYTDIFGTNHVTVQEEIKTSLGLSDVDFTTAVYKSGQMNGGQTDHAVTISGLDATAKYVVYAGFGMLRTQYNEQVMGVQFDASGYTTVEALEYIVTVAGTGTTKESRYQPFAAGTQICPGTHGLMLTRLVNVQPKADGAIALTFKGAKGGINFLAVAKVNESKPTSKTFDISDSVSYADLETEGLTSVTLNLTADATVTFSEAVSASLTFSGSGNLTVKGAQHLTIANVTDSAVTGNVTYEFGGAYTAADGLKNKIKAAASKYKFVFTGNATVDFTSANLGTINTHLVFSGDASTLKITNGNSKFAASATYDNPTILVERGTLTFYGHDVTGWAAGTDANGIIRVKNGATLQLENHGTGTFYYNQRIAIDAGATVNVGSSLNGNQFRMTEGVNGQQIWVQDCASDMTATPAKLVLTSGQLALAKDGSAQGIGVYVGANAKLQITGTINSMNNAGTQAVDNSFARPIKKTGAGVLEVSGTQGVTYEVAEGSIGGDATVQKMTLVSGASLVLKDNKSLTVQTALTLANPINLVCEPVHGMMVITPPSDFDASGYKATLNGAANEYDLYLDGGALKLKYKTPPAFPEGFGDFVIEVANGKVGEISVDVSKLSLNDYATDSGVSYKLVFGDKVVVGLRTENIVTFDLAAGGFLSGHVYRGDFVVEFPDGEVKKPITVYEGVRTPTWISSELIIRKQGTINDAQGETIKLEEEESILNHDPDYIDNCDSVYMVTFSASEAVDADTESVGDSQGGLRLVKVDESTVKLEYLFNDENDNNTVKWGDQWPDGTKTGAVTLALNASVTVRVEFHYAKGEDGDTSYVKYSIGEDYAKSVTSWAEAKKVTEVFIADGTVLPDDLKGLFQLDSAVIVDIELKPGEGDTIDYTSVEAANAALETLKVGICDAVKSVLTTTEDQETYRKYFQLVVVPSTTLEGGFSVKTEFTTAAKTEIEEELEDELEKVVEAFNSVDGKAEIAAKPGLYYGVKRGDSLEAMSVKENLQMAGADGKVTLAITKPDTSKSHFYRIIVSPTPSETK